MNREKKDERADMEAWVLGSITLVLSELGGVLNRAH
jgi:hypothetical protein